MPRTRSLAWSELKIGIVTVVAIVLALSLVLAGGGEAGFWWQRYPLKTRFNDVMGLKPGAVVRLSGKEVGAVTEVKFAGMQVEVSLELSKDVRPLVTTDAIASIGSLSLLGEPIIDIKGAQTGTPLDDWQYIPASQSRGQLDELTTKASKGIEETSALIADIRAGKGTIGKLVTDEALYNELNKFVTSAEDVTRAINQGKGTIGGLMQDPAAYQSLKASLENLQAMTARINSGQGALARLINDDALGKSISNTTANLEQATGKINSSAGTAGKLINDTQLYDRFTSVGQRLDQLMSGLESGRGTAGQLLKDQQLYENMNKTVVELRDLLAAIRKDPKKYLRVSVSIF